MPTSFPEEARPVSSLQNATVKLIRSLELRKNRKETGLFVAEGAKVVATARDTGWPPVFLLFNSVARETRIVRELIEWALGAKAECLEVSDEILSKLSTKDNPQNVIGVFHQRWSQRDLLFSSSKEKTLIALEEVRDPGNLGTIIRTADATGTQGVILIGHCCDPYSREAVRASMGSIFNVPILKASHQEFQEMLPAWPGEIIGTHLSASSDFRREYAAQTLLLMGSEGPGLSPDLTDLCTTLVKIPMSGKADSLNLATASALMLYEIRKSALGI